MLNFIKKYGILIVLLIFTIFIAVNKYLKINKEVSINDLQETTQVSATIYKKILMENKNLEIENENLKKLAKNLKERFYVNIKGKYNAINLSGKTQVDFEDILINGENEGLKLSGLANKDSFNFMIRQQPLNLDVLIAEDEKGIWSFLINTNNPHLNISNINGSVKSFEPKWYQKFGLITGGGYVYNVGILTEWGVSYNGYCLSFITGKRNGVFVRKSFNLK